MIAYGLRGRKRPAGSEVAHDGNSLENLGFPLALQGDELLSIVRRNSAVIWRKEARSEGEVLEAMRRGEDVSDRGVVTLVLSGMMHQLNLFGGRIWELADGSKTSLEIAAAIADEFGWEPALVKPDVEEFVTDLVGKGWLGYVDD
jgi:pyrroloquinoline quinone biosynthesis protein D